MQGSEQATALLCLKSEWGKKTYGEETNSLRYLKLELDATTPSSELQKISLCLQLFIINWFNFLNLKSVRNVWEGREKKKTHTN
jgi:hypothetical protein